MGLTPAFNYDIPQLPDGSWTGGSANASVGLVEPSMFDASTQLVDPTNTGDIGALQDVSTPFLPSVNNPETAGHPDLGAVLNNALNLAFTGWQLASQPQGTPKTVTTTAGPTRIASGPGATLAPVVPQQGSLVSSIFGPNLFSSQTFILLLVLVIVYFVLRK